MMKISIKSYNKYSLRDTIITLLIMSYFALMVINIYIESSNRFLDWYLGFFVAVLALTLSLKKIMPLKKEIMFYIVLLLVHLLCVAYNNNSELTSVIQYLRYIMIAMAMSRVRLNHYITRIVLFVFMAFFLGFVISGHGAAGILKNGISVNAISVHLILFEIMYLISVRENIGTEALVVTLVAFIIVVWSGSRSGVFASIFLILAALQDNKGKRRSRIIKWGVVFACIVLGFVIIVSVPSTLDMIKMKNTNGDGLLNNPRFEILKEYWGDMSSSVTRFVLGSNLNDVEIVNYYDGNPHNSYIRLHAMFGIMGVFIVMVMCINSLVLFLKNNKMYFFLVIAIIIRSFSDILAFPGLYDPLFWYFLFEIPLLYKCNVVQFVNQYSEG